MGGPHKYITDVNNNPIYRKMEENFGIGPDYAFTEVSISSNAITASYPTHLVDAAGTINDIDTSSGVYAGMQLVLMRKAGAGTVTIADDAGTGLSNIIVHGGSFNLDSDYDLIRLVHNGTEWVGVGSNFS